MIVIKKFVGNYAKTLSEKQRRSKKLVVTLDPNSNYEIKAITQGEKDYGVIVAGQNLFFVLDKALSELVKKLP